MSTRLIGHRGVGALAPENTLPSYALAAQLGGYWGVECDIHETADGEFILLHDDTLNDTTNAVVELPQLAREDGGIYAKDLTLEEIAQLRVRDRDNPPRYRNVEKYGAVRVPTLAQYLEVCEKHGLVPVIEIKELSNPTGFLETVKNSFKGHFVIISFVRDALRSVLTLDPTIDTQLLFSQGNRIGAKDIEEARALGARGIDIHYGSVSRRVVRLAHAAGLEVNAWEWRPRVPAHRIRRVLSCGVDYITSDLPIKSRRITLG